MCSHVLTFFATSSICLVASSSFSCLYTSGLERWSAKARSTYVEVSMRARPRFLSQLTTRMSVRRARVDNARFWKGSRLVDFARLTRSLRSIWRRKLFVLSWISGGISHGFGAQSESTWSLGLYISSETRGLPAK